MGAPTVDFGPDQERTTVFNVRLPQAGIVAVAGVVAWLTILTAGATGFLVAPLVLLVGVMLAFLRLPYVGVHADRIVVAAVRYSWRALARKTRVRRKVTAWKFTAEKVEAPEQQPSPALAGVKILSWTDERQRLTGVIHDPVCGGWLAVIALDGQRTNGLDAGEVEASLRGWEAVLHAVGADTGMRVRRFGWITVSAPASGEALREHMERGADLSHPLASSYAELVDEAGPVSDVHETFVCVQVTGGGRFTKAQRAEGADWVAACKVLTRAVDAVLAELTVTGYLVRGVLSPGELSRMNRLGHRPFDRADLDARGLRGVTVTPDTAWPSVVDEHPGAYVTDGTWHRTWEVEHWPQTTVPARFLRSVALQPECVRRMAVWYRPVDAASASMAGERDRVGAEVGEHFRDRWGLVKTRKKSAQEDRTVGYLDQLVAGAVPFDVTGWVTVSARSLEGLDAAEDEILAAARPAQLSLRRRDLEQAQCHSHTLPVGRGIDERWGGS